MRTADYGQIYVTLSQKYMCDDKVHTVLLHYAFSLRTQQKDLLL